MILFSNFLAEEGGGVLNQRVEDLQHPTGLHERLCMRTGLFRGP